MISKLPGTLYEGVNEDTHKVDLAQIGRQLHSPLAAAFELFGALSFTNATPGDLLDARLRQLQA
jgi:hypothetical protein